MAIIPNTTEPGKIEFSFFTTSVTSKNHKAQPVSLAAYWAAIQGGSAQWINKIEKVRELAQFKNDKAISTKTGREVKSKRASDYDNAKLRLGYAVPTGIWNPNHRHDERGCQATDCPGSGLLQASGLFYLDFDHLTQEQIVDLRELGQALPFAVAGWQSAGGSGYRIYCLATPAPTTSKDTKQAHTVAQQTLAAGPMAKYLAYSDKAVSNIMRPDFISYDRQAWLKQTVEPLQWLPLETTNQPTEPDLDTTLLDAYPVPAEYNDWVGALAKIKEAGFTMAAAISWSERGANSKPNEVESRWVGLPCSTPQAKALESIRRAACKPKQRRQSKPSQAVKATTPVVAPVALRRPTPPNGDTWQDLGSYIANALLKDKYAYIGRNQWLAWRVNHWVFLEKNDPELTDLVWSNRYLMAHHLAEDGNTDLAKLIASKGLSRELASTKGGELMAELRTSLTRQFELPPDYIVACQNGLLDVRTLTLEPHSPYSDYLITVVAGGSYLDTLSTTDALAIADNRIQIAIPDRQRRETLYAALAMSLGGKAAGKNRGSVLCLYGASGGGKSNTAGVALAVFGGYAFTANTEAIGASGDVNEAVASLLEANPRLILFAEVNRVPVKSVLRFTGGDSITARGPHKSSVTRILTASALITCVNLPRMAMDSGLKRRLVGLHFPAPVDVDDGEDTKETDLDTRNGILTLLMRMANKMWSGVKLIPDDDSDTQAARADADPYEAFIADMTDKDSGRTIDALLGELEDDWEESKPPSKRALSEKLKAHPDWSVVRDRQPDGRRCRVAIRSEHYIQSTLVW